MMAYSLSTLMLLSIMAASRGENTMRANIFVEDPLNFEDYGPPPATDTVTFYDCSSSHRGSSRGPGEFQVYHNGQWWTQSCPQSLVWNQTLCRCDYPGGSRHPVVCRDYRPSSSGLQDRYEQVVNGRWLERDCSLAVAGLVWNQEACQCVWGPLSDRKVTGQGITPCDVMLNVTFDDGLRDEAKGSFIELSRGNPVSIVALSGPEGFYSPRAAHFTDSAINIWYFADNELGSSLRVEFNFKLTARPERRDMYHMLLSNGCNVTSTGFTTPSLAIGYRPTDQTYLLAFETISARKAIVCQKYLGAYDWHTVSLIYEDGTLLLRVDGHPCIISQDFTGPIQKTPCPLTLGTDPLGKQAFYEGYLDNLVIARYCRRYLDQEQTEDSQPPTPNEPTILNDNRGLDAFSTGTGQRRYHSQPFLSTFDESLHIYNTEPWNRNENPDVGYATGTDTKDLSYSNTNARKRYETRLSSTSQRNIDLRYDFGDKLTSSNRQEPGYRYWYNKQVGNRYNSYQIPRGNIQASTATRRQRYVSDEFLENAEPVIAETKYAKEFRGGPLNNDEMNIRADFHGKESQKQAKPQETSEPEEPAVPLNSYYFVKGDKRRGQQTVKWYERPMKINTNNINQHQGLDRSSTNYPLIKEYRNQKQYLGADTQNANTSQNKEMVNHNDKQDQDNSLQRESTTLPPKFEREIVTSRKYENSRKDEDKQGSNKDHDADRTDLVENWLPGGANSYQENSDKADSEKTDHSNKNNVFRANRDVAVKPDINAESMETSGYGKNKRRPIMTSSSGDSSDETKEEDISDESEGSPENSASEEEAPILKDFTDKVHMNLLIEFPPYNGMQYQRTLSTKLSD